MGGDVVPKCPDAVEQRRKWHPPDRQPGQMSQRGRGSALQRCVGPRKPPKGRHHLGVQVSWRIEHIPGSKPGNDRIPTWIVGEVEHRQDRGVDDRDAHEASRTSRTAATASSTVTALPVGAGYSAR